MIKGLGVDEAAWLFIDVAETIEVVGSPSVHHHSWLIIDGSVLANDGIPDMAHADCLMLLATGIAMATPVEPLNFC